MPKDSDPPIIVTGGGGDGGGSRAPSKRARNVVTVYCDPEDSKGPKKFKTKINKHAEITAMVLDFPDMPGQEQITITGYDVYNVKITFNTSAGTEPSSRKKKKTPAKRPVARKKSK